MQQRQKCPEPGPREREKKINGVEDALETLFQKSEEMVGTINPMRETMTV